MDISRKTDYALRMLAMLADGENNLFSGWAEPVRLGLLQSR